MSETDLEQNPPNAPAKPKLSTLQILLLGTVVTLISTVVFLGLFALFSQLTRQEQPQQAAGQGFADVEGMEAFDGSTAYNPPREIADFTLTSHTGQTIGLSDFEGKLALIFFGFTHCPDVCPLTLDEFKNVRQALGEDAAALDFIFISVDGARDTPEALNAYFEQRSVDFVTGLSGDQQAVRQISAAFDVEFFITPETADQENYLITHTANTYLLDREGNLVMKFAFGTDANVIADHIRTFLA